MTRQEAEDLAIRISQSFPTRRGIDGVAVDVWAEYLEPLDAGRAGTAYARLLRKLTAPPAIADFAAEYGQVRGETAQRFGPDERAVGPAQHVVELRRKAAFGDDAAAAELARWEPMLAKTSKLATASALQTGPG